MTQSATTASKSIPQRADIADKNKWNMADLYADDAAWEADYKRAQGLVTAASTYIGKLRNSAETLYEALTNRSDLLQICHNLYQYAKLNQDLDNRVSKYQAMTERAAMVTSQANAAYAFLEPELLQIDDERLRQMAKRFPKTDVYDFYIINLIRTRKHIRSAEVEELLAQAAMIARGPDTIFSMLDDADIKYPAITDDKGVEIQLTKQRYAKLMESPVQDVRRRAHESFMSVYRDHVNTLGATLASSLQKDLFYARARHYESCLHDALDTFNIPVEVYRSLIEVTEGNLQGFHKWMAVRKKILQLDKLYPYDIYCPLFPDQNYEVPYDQAINEVKEAIKPLGPQYGEILRKAFESRWVDVYETEGKSGGAYSWGNYATHPFVMMNYNNTINNMFTLAHEMGHALHSYLSNKTQSYPKAQYSIFVAEVASTLNEGLLLQHFLKKTTDVKQKLFLLNRQIDNTMGTFFHQVFFANFELMIHDLVEKGEALSPERACQLWDEFNKRYYGPAVTVDELSRYKWARIPHFYMTFYVYQYATSYAASQAILTKFLAGEKGIIERYLTLISSGGNDYPINQLIQCGVDMTTPDPFLATLRLFEKQVDEVMRLTGIA